MIQFTNNDFCRKCQGQCCKDASGVYAPEDFEELTFDVLLKLYQEGKIMISHISEKYGNKTEGWVLKPAQEGCDSIQYEIMIKGRCKFLTDEGCSLDYYHRPRGCKLLLPDEIAGRKACRELYTLDKAVREWQAFQELLEGLIVHIWSLERENKNEFSFDHLQCKVCGGKCCQNSGCFFSPEDFNGITFEKLKRILEKGYISIVEVQKKHSGFEVDVLVLRVREVGGDVVDRNLTENARCILLEENGCPFEDDDRPYGGKALIPERFLEGSQGCLRGYSTRQCAADWLPYQDILQELKTEFDGKTVEFSEIF